MTSSRATQLRAKTLAGSRIAACWAIFDLTRPLPDLVDDARLDLPQIATDLHVQTGSPEIWRMVREDCLTWLVLDLPARPPA